MFQSVRLRHSSIRLNDYKFFTFPCSQTVYESLISSDTDIESMNQSYFSIEWVGKLQLILQGHDDDMILVCCSALCSCVCVRMFFWNVLVSSQRFLDLSLCTLLDKHVSVLEHCHFFGVEGFVTIVAENICVCSGILL